MKYIKEFVVAGYLLAPHSGCSARPIVVPSSSISTSTSTSTLAVLLSNSTAPLVGSTTSSVAGLTIGIAMATSRPSSEEASISVSTVIEPAATGYTSATLDKPSMVDALVGNGSVVKTPAGGYNATATSGSALISNSAFVTMPAGHNATIIGVSTLVSNNTHRGNRGDDTKDSKLPAPSTMFASITAPLNSSPKPARTTAPFINSTATSINNGTKPTSVTVPFMPTGVTALYTNSTKTVSTTALLPNNTMAANESTLSSNGTKLANQFEAVPTTSTSHMSTGVPDAGTAGTAQSTVLPTTTPVATEGLKTTWPSTPTTPVATEGPTTTWLSTPTTINPPQGSTSSIPSATTPAIKKTPWIKPLLIATLTVVVGAVAGFIVKQLVLPFIMFLIVVQYPEVAAWYHG